MPQHNFRNSCGKIIPIVCLFLLSVQQNRTLCAAEDTRVFKIGILLSNDDVENEYIISGANSALVELNKKGLPQFELITKLHKNQWGQEADDAVDLITYEDTKGFIAPASGIISHLLFQVSGRTKIPAVTLCSDTSVTGATIPWCVRIVPTTVEEIRAIAEHIKPSNVRVLKSVVFAPSGRAGREIVKDIENGVKNTPFEISKIIFLDIGKPVKQDELRSSLQQKPDYIFLWLSHGDAVRAINGLRNGGFEGTFIITSKLFSSEFVSYISSFRGNVYFATTPLENAIESGREIFSKALEPPFQSYISILAHDAVWLLANHIKDCDLEQPHKNFPPSKVNGWTGELVFNKNGDRITKLKVWKIFDGKIINVGN